MNLQNNVSDWQAFAITLADIAKSITLAHFRKSFSVQQKIDQSPVTIVDQMAESAMRDWILKHFPDHSILGEEAAATTGSSDMHWVLDPIDGTRSFIAGNPLYGTLIALFKNNHPILSLIDMPALNERFIATDAGAFLYQAKTCTPLKTRQQTTLKDALLFSTDPQMFTEAEIAQLKPLQQQVAMQRYTGDCYLYAALAAGWIDLVVESDLKPYDFMPLVKLVEQAGGVITDWQGKPLSFTSSGQVLASAHPALHQSALSYLNNANNP